MRYLRFSLAAAALVASAAIASPADPKNGAEYVTLTPAQATVAVGKKVEVVELFAYHCPACYIMEPHVEEWVKKHKDDVSFRRIPFPFKGANDSEARLFLTLEAMGVAETVGPKVFKAVHLERKRLMSDDDILEWVAKSRVVDNAKFKAAWNSFGVMTKLRRLPAIAAAYKANGTPSFIVDGRFLTSPSSIGEANPGLERQLPEATKTTLDALVAKVLKEKGVAATPATPAAAAKPAAKPATKPAAPATKPATAPVSK
jgi:thiol:disulfide interchange protein DsbA